MRVAVYAIALNEVRHVERFLAACAPADLVMVADTGSTDGTFEALERGGATALRIAVRPWRFDDARNAALALVPADIDICFALDLDEVPAPGWRAALEAGWTPETTMGRYRYVSSHLPGGAPGHVLSGYKLHRRFGYRWQHMCHEILMADRLERPPLETWLPGLVVDHWQDRGKDRSGYLALLEAAVREQPQDLRDLFLLGREYNHVRRWRDGEAIHRRYLAVPGPSSKHESAMVRLLLSRCRMALGDPTGAADCLHDGLALVPDMRDLWFELALLHSACGRFRVSYEASLRGLALPEQLGPIAYLPENYGGGPFHRASLAAWRLGRLSAALALAAQAVTIDPGNAIYERHVRELDGDGSRAGRSPTPIPAPTPARA